MLTDDRSSSSRPALPARAGLPRRLALGAALGALALGLAVALAACDSTSSSSSGGPSDANANTNGANANAGNPDTAQLRAQVLQALGEQVILETYTRFAQKSAALEAAAEAFAAAPDDADARANAQQAWRDALAVWQEAEVFQLGPAGIMGDVVGGEDRRDAIYSWPLVNRCRVDQELVEQAFDDPDAFQAEPVNVRGLDAMEYLLFNTTDANACSPNSGINRDGDWAAIPAPDLNARRARYASTLAALVRAEADLLQDAWAPSGDNWAAKLAAQDGTFATSQEALNALSDAMFYLEKEVRDMKLADIVGLSDACSDPTCPEALESPFAQHSRENTLANLRAFRRLLAGPGDDGLGFDDLLQQAGAAALSDAMLAHLDASIAMAEAMDRSFLDLLTQDPDQLVALYDELSKLITLFKTQFLSVLDLDLPQRVEGDND